MSQPTTTSTFAHSTDDRVDNVDENDTGTSEDLDVANPGTTANNDVKDEDSSLTEKVSSGHVGSSALAHSMLQHSGVDNGRKDEGNHENRDEVKPLEINEDGHLVDSEGNKVFTTNEEAVKDGSMVLDAKGRQPGVYLDDLEDLQRRRYAEALENATNAAAAGTNSPVERQVNVRNSGMPPVTVVSKQEHPVDGNAQDENAKVPELESNPLPAE